MKYSNFIFIALIISTPAFSMRRSACTLACMSESQYRELVRLAQRQEFVNTINNVQKDLNDLERIEQHLKEPRLTKSFGFRFFRSLEKQNLGLVGAIACTSIPAGTLISTYAAARVAEQLYLKAYPLHEMMLEMAPLFAAGGSLAGAGSLGAAILLGTIGIPAKIGRKLLESKDEENPDYQHAKKNLKYVQTLMAQAKTLPVETNFEEQKKD